MDRYALAGAKAVALRLVRRFRESADASAEAVRMVEDIDPALLGQLGEQVGTILRQLSYSLLQGGRIDEALAVMNRSVALCASPAARNYSLVYAAGANAFAGDIARATSLQAAIDTAAWPDGLEWSYMNGLGLVAQGFERLDAMDSAGALDVLHGADSYLQTAEFWPFFTAISVSARHGAGQAQAEAERVTKELEALVPPPGIGDNVATEHLYAVLAHAWIASGRLDDATRLLDDRRPDSPHLASARIGVLLRHGDGRRAFQRARELLELPDHTLRSRAATQTIGALAALNRDETDLAYSWLSSAAVSYETYGTRAHVAVLSPRGRSKLGEFARECGSASLRRYLERPAGSMPSSGTDTVALTPRESVVLNKLGEHGSIREVAEALVVSPHTVKTQLQAIYRKLGVSSRRSALEAARELGLIELVEPPGE